jgi:hypothetical protein
VWFEEQLEVYRSRNLMGATLIPPEAVADLAVLLDGEAGAISATRRVFDTPLS